MLRTVNCDLLIADTMMPGNLKLEFIEELPRVADGMPVILITAYPSMVSAIHSIESPVIAACMLKPFDFGDLCAQVRFPLSGTECTAQYRP